jgi:hypothetical protein
MFLVRVSYKINGESAAQGEMQRHVARATGSTLHRILAGRFGCNRIAPLGAAWSLIGRDEIHLWLVGRGY